MFGDILGFNKPAGTNKRTGAHRKWPRDPKLKELGQFAFFAIDTDVEGYVTYMADLQGWSKEEIMVYAAHLRREIRNSAIHGYYSVKAVWGRKPEA